MCELNNNCYKKGLRSTIYAITGILIFLVIIQVVVDPYFHYHKPITKYRLNDERYINDGIARHFDYDAIITGNSLCQNFSTFQYDELFGTNSVKLPYSGAGYKEIWESLGRALEYNDGVKEVLVCMDLQDLDREADWERYEGNPTYLYDDNVFNDIKYIFNKDAIYRGTLYNLIWTVTGHENTSMDEYSTWERETGPEVACSYLKPVTDDMVADSQVFDEEDKDRETKNLTQNVIKVIEANPNVIFRLVIPPSSIARWCEYYERGEVQYRIDSLEYALSVLLHYNNVEVYAFDDAFDITTDLNKYSDTIHYDSETNEWMLIQINEGKHRITNRSRSVYSEKTMKYYSGYIYDRLNVFISE